MGRVGTRSTALEGNSGADAAPDSAKPEATEEKKMIREAVNDSVRTRVASVPESSFGDVRSSSKVVDPKALRTQRSVGDLNVGLYDAEEEGGFAGLGLLKLRGSERTVEKLESFSSNGKKAATLSDTGRIINLDETEEDPDGKPENFEAKSGVNGGVEGNGSSFDDVGEDPRGKFELTEEDMGEDEGLHEFSVGDFVWGKIKNHPWWPAQVCHPLDASEYAVKLKPKGSRQLLVAYFGDCTFAWCHPSQLKPFEENFQEMSKQGGSKAFVNAVQQAVDEIGRLVKLEMSCGCVKEEFLSGLSQPLALNAGIKEGVLVPEGRVGKFVAHISEPADLLAELKHVAQAASVSSVLELNALRSWLSAFYYSEGVYELPIFVEAQPIPGLEDDSKAVEVPFQGPFEDWLSSPAKAGQTDQTLSQSSPEFLEHRQYHKRKQKSIADLLGGDGDIRATTKDGGNMAKEGVISEKPGSLSVRKKRKGSESHDESNLTSESEKRRAKLSKSGTSTRTKRLSGVENGSGSKEEIKNFPLSRRRKKDDGMGGETKEEAGYSPVSRDGELRNGALDSEVKDQIENRTLTRERKKSKYLSPPFTNPDTGKSKRDIDVEFLKVSSESELEGGMSGAASNLVGSPQILNGRTEIIPRKHITELGLGHENSGGSGGPKTLEGDKKKSIDPMKSNASTSLVLSEVCSAAVNPTIPIKKKSFEIVWNFMTIFRDTSYRNGSNYELYKSHQHPRKRNNSGSAPGSLGKGRKKTAENLPDSESGQKKIQKSQETKSDKAILRQGAEKPSSKPGMQKSKHGAGTPEMKRSRKKVDEKASPASLFVTFGPGSSLPTKADLIEIYSKFGELNETETEMFYNNFCARVSFVRISDAEEALNHSQNDSPFGASNVNFRLHNLSAASKVRELSEISKSPPAKSTGKTKSQPAASQQPVVGEASQDSQLDFIRQKLEKLTSMLDNSEGKVSAVTKSKLESEIKELLGTVSTMVESSS